MRNAGLDEALHVRIKDFKIKNKKKKMESRLPGEISITSDMQMTLPLLQKVKKN